MFFLAPYRFIHACSQNKATSYSHLVLLRWSALCLTHLCVSHLCVSRTSVSYAPLCHTPLCRAPLCHAPLCLMHLCVTHLCVMHLCVTHLCVTHHCVTHHCVTHLCVMQVVSSVSRSSQRPFTGVCVCATERLDYHIDNKLINLNSRIYLEWLCYWLDLA